MCKLSQTFVKTNRIDPDIRGVDYSPPVPTTIRSVLFISGPGFAVIPTPPLWSRIPNCTLYQDPLLYTVFSPSPLKVFHKKEEFFSFTKTEGREKRRTYGLLLLHYEPWWRRWNPVLPSVVVVRLLETRRRGWILVERGLKNNVIFQLTEMKILRTINRKNNG